jgi:hypothetical protein
MAYTNVNVISSCKYLFVKGNSYTGANEATLKIKPLHAQGSTEVYTLIYASNNAGQIMINIPDLPFSGGVYEIDIIENATSVAKKLVMIHCDIDCCLVKLTNELLDCECDCAKCASSLAKAEKIYLLLHSANTAIELFNNVNTSNSGYALDAANKYKKAKELCDASCGCNC